jgi:nitrite reductase (NADH) small subunit/3-phenylpropionate/trans-cinnamate dioxygenase ferredoxin subunit
MTSFTTVAKVGDIAEGEGQGYTVAGRLIAVFNDRGEYHAIDDLCPHMGAALSPGYILDGEVVCPWHAWRFCIRTGTWSDNDALSVNVFAVRVEGDEIQVQVPEREE